MDKSVAAPSLGRLAGRVELFPDEALESFLFRSGLHNEIRRTRELAALLGISGQSRPQSDRIDAAAHVLGTSASSLTRSATWKMTDPSRAGWRQWFGTAVPEKLLRTAKRRFTRSIGNVGDHPAIWMIASARFCPTTYEEIWSACPACGRELPWTKAHEIGECPHCEAEFSRQTAETLPAALRPAYSAAFRLIDPDPDKRSKELKKLPDALSGVDAGEAFCTLMSFAGAVHGLARAKAGAEKPFKDARHYEAPEPEDIARAHGLLLNWPASLHELVAEFQATVGSPRYRGGLHTLVAYLRANSKTSRLQELVDQELPSAVKKTGVAFYARGDSRLLSEARGGLVSVSQARAEFNIDNRTLARLPSDSPCLHGRSSSFGGAALYDQHALQEAITAYRSSRSFELAGKSIGVPSFVIPAFIDAGLLKAETNSDAVALAAGGDLVAEHSIAELRTALSGFRGLTRKSGEPIPLARLLRWNVRPETWAALAEAVVSERLKARVVEPNLSLPSFERLGVSRENFLEWLRCEAPVRPTSPSACSASKGDVALALGLNSNAVRCAVTLGHLVPTEGPEETILHSSLSSFAEQWISSSIAAELIGRTPRAWFKVYQDASLTELPLSDPGMKPFITLFKRDEVVRHHEAISPTRCRLRLI